MIRIKNISIFAEWILTQDSINIFNRSFEENLMINVFYCPNRFWKTTLFQILRDFFRFDDKKIDISKVRIENYIVNKIEISLEIKGFTKSLSYTLRESDKKQWNKVLSSNISEADIHDLNKEIFNQNKLIKDTDNNKNIWLWGKITIPSLTRFNFLSNDRIISSKSEESYIVDSHKDWKAKWILLNYILWDNFTFQWRSNLETMTSIYSYHFNKNRIEELETEKKQIKWQKTDHWLFEYKSKEIELQISNIEEELQRERASLLDIECAMKKLNSLLKEAKSYLWENNDFIKILYQELDELEKTKNEIHNNEIQIKEKLENSISENQNWISNNISNYERLEIEIKKLSSMNDINQSVADYYETIKNTNRDQLLDIYKELIEFTWFKWAIVNLDILKVNVNRVKDYSQAILYCCRIIFLVALQIYKQKNNTARTLWIWFFDWLLDWVWFSLMKNLLNGINSYFNKYPEHKAQLFFFIPKISDEKDSFDVFLEENKQLIYTHEIKNKDKLFST